MKYKFNRKAANYHCVDHNCVCLYLWLLSESGLGSGSHSASDSCRKMPETVYLEGSAANWGWQMEAAIKIQLVWGLRESPFVLSRLSRISISISRQWRSGSLLHNSAIRRCPLVSWPWFPRRRQCPEGLDSLMHTKTLPGCEMWNAWHSVLSPLPILRFLDSPSLGPAPNVALKSAEGKAPENMLITSWARPFREVCSSAKYDILFRGNATLKDENSAPKRDSLIRQHIVTEWIGRFIQSQMLAVSI